MYLFYIKYVLIYYLLYIIILCFEVPINNYNQWIENNEIMKIKNISWRGHIGKSAEKKNEIVKKNWKKKIMWQGWLAHIKI